VANKVVAIGASAGGLEPLRELLRELPPNFAAAIIVAVHSGPESRLKNTLDLFSDISLEICNAESGIEPTPGVVYVVPGAKHVLLSHGRLEISDLVRDSGFRPSIDALFMTLATEYRDNAIAVVLSGTLNDGMRGAQVLYDLGGITLVQDPEDAKFASMPQSVVQANHPVEIISAKQIGRWLVESVGTTDLEA